MGGVEQSIRRPAGGMAIAMLLPVFPGQTHVWIWREVCELRRRGERVELFATREPPEMSRARHEFAESARRETEYLWPIRWGRAAAALAWACATRPGRVVGCVRELLALRGQGVRGGWKVLGLLVPGCVLARSMVRKGVGHLHVHSAASSAVLAMVAKRLTGVPFSVVVNASLESWGGALDRKLGAAAFVVTHSAWVKEEIERKVAGLPAGHVRRAPVGVDLEKWRPREGREYERPRGRAWRVVAVGRLHRNKGHDDLMRAVKVLRDEGRELELTIVGGGPEEEGLRGLVTELGLDGVARLTGPLGEHEVMEQLHGADVFALATREEALGVVFMEAMALGVPTVGCDVGGVGEVIVDGRTGLLAPARDVEGFARVLGRMLDEDELRERVGREGRRWIEERFDSRAGAGMLLEAIRGVSACQAKEATWTAASRSSAPC